MIAAEVKYKKTGNEWVPEIPEHWQYLKLKFVSKLQGGFAFKSGDFDYEGIPVIRISDVNDVFNEDQCPKYPLKKGQINEAFKVLNDDILIALTGATIGKTCLVNGLSKFAYLNQRVAKVKQQDPFIYYCLSSKFIQEQIKLKCYGSAQENISNADIENFYIPYPPATERQTIVNFINSESAKITRFIQTKQRLIELLKEQRQSIITHAVTKGIDEGVKMKETGIEWMPEVPEHWEIRRLKSIVSGATNGVWGSEPKNNDEDIVCIRVVDIDTTNYGIDTSNLTRRSISLNDQQGRLLSLGDLIIEKSGGGDISPVGRVVIFNQEIKAVTSNFMGRLNIIDDVYKEFLYYLFSTLYAKRINIPSIKATTGIQNLDLYAYLQNRVPIPTIDEQKRIVEHIKTETRTLDIAISKAEREIELIKEYREALIAEAVTGKMKL